MLNDLYANATKTYVERFIIILRLTGVSYRSQRLNNLGAWGYLIHISRSKGLTLYMMIR